MSKFCDEAGRAQPKTQRKKFMNWKKFFIAFIAAFVFVFLFEWLLHGVLMHSSYQETSTLWRPEAGFKSYFPMLVLGQLVFVFFFTMIFASGFAGGGPVGGARFGVLVGLLGVGANLIQFAVQPLTAKILVSWAIGGIIEFAIAGAIVGAIYKRTSSL
jgi:hypothetical protein